jgi:hypothetical protein
MKTAHLLRCARPTHSDVLSTYASTRRLFARLGWTVLIGLLCRHHAQAGREFVPEREPSDSDGA